MIVGIGTDLIEIARVDKACENPRFLESYYTTREQELIEQDKKRAASNFAVKESVAKAFGTGVRHFSLSDIEVLRDELGKPYVELHGHALVIANRMGIDSIHVSITNTMEFASAFVVAERKDIKNS